MNYKVYKLKFSTSVRFSSLNNQGVLFDSDFTTPSSTLFSALYITALELQDKELEEYFKTNEFLLSDLLPYFNDLLYIPKPILQFTSKYDVDKKEMKNLKYIPLNTIKNYFDNPMEIIEQEKKYNFGYFTEHTKVTTKKQGKSSEPYSIETFTFQEESGLYFIANIPPHLEEKFLILLEMLGTHGIGGKKSSGYGKFTIKEFFYYELIHSLITKENNKYMTLSTFIPLKEELQIVKDGTYLLNIKSGFSYSASYTNNPVKKENKLTIQKGSCFNQKLKGQLYIEQNGNHPIYTYGRALMIGIDINE